jgi:hypothetical protein
MRFFSPTRLVGVALVTSGACSLSSLDDLKGGGRPIVDAGKDTSLGSDSSDSGSDVTTCDANLGSDPNNCGECGNACDPGDICKSSTCVPCDSAVQDCDEDGWLVSDGDCCDKPGGCDDVPPELVNPGAVELPLNGIDDNCNTLVDLFDVQDTAKCDTSLYSDSPAGESYARAMDICRTTTEEPAMLADRTWGLISAALQRADGSALEDLRARSIRPTFGSAVSADSGDSMVVLSSGIASDATQTTPGPNGGAPAGSNVSNFHTPFSLVDISTCTNTNCISDWLAAENLPLKKANELPTAPDCPVIDGGFVPPAHEVNDSVMLELVIRAPTNARAFTFRTYFFSAEYPEFVCSAYNDQYVALIDTPSGVPSPIANPVDKNLLTYASAGKKWPIGINVAAGTNLFAVCESEATNPTCWDPDLDPASCSQGAGDLLGTGFEQGSSGCLFGGGTYWRAVNGNIIPGENVRLRLVIWDVGDSGYDSLALIDGFQWLPDPIQPGTK